MTIHPRIAARIAKLDFDELEALYHFGFAAAACETSPGSDAMPFIMGPDAIEARPARVRALRSLTLSALGTCSELDRATARLADRIEATP